MKTLAHCRNIIADPDLLLSSSTNYETGSMDGCPWDDPEVFYAVHAVLPRLPQVREAFIAFFTGALETWERFSAKYSPDGLIVNATPGERERAWMPTTNDANEGALGELRIASRRAPNMTLHQLNARQMYKKNDTKIYRRHLSSKDHRMVRVKAQLVDSSGLTKKHRLAQAKADAIIVVKKRAKDIEKADKKAKIDAALDKLTSTLWLTKEVILCDPDTGKGRSNEALDSQLAWHRREELPRLKKPADSQIPKVSKIPNKALKIAALISTVRQYNVTVGGPIIPSLGGDLDVGTDEDGDINSLIEDHRFGGNKHDQTARDGPDHCRSPVPVTTSPARAPHALFVEPEGSEYTQEDVGALTGVIGNRIGALKKSYRDHRDKLGSTGQGLVAENREGEIETGSNIENIWDLIKKKFPWYKRMHALMGSSPVVDRSALSHSQTSVDLSVLDKKNGKAKKSKRRTVFDGFYVIKRVRPTSGKAR
ncbi:hypothetical protein B0H10DRAFT_2225653 [Mycena sp. CBHHK59/15]|nr:hypothetical protein B0H10DRAFT_2225653 [Mycena sp. CBHHK59/15]